MTDELETLRSDLATKTRALAESQAECAALALDHEKTSSALRQMNRWIGECEKLRAQLAQQKKLTAGQQKTASKIGREFDLLQKDWLKAIEERDTLRAQLAERDREIAGITQALEQVQGWRNEETQELDRLRARLSACEPVVEAVREWQALAKDPNADLDAEVEAQRKALAAALPEKRTP